MKLKTTQWIAIAACALLVAVIYLFADTKKATPPKPEGPQAVRDTEGQKPEEPSFDWHGYLQQINSAVTNQDTLHLLDKWDAAGTETDLRSLANYYYGKGEIVAEAHYVLLLGQLRRDTMLVHAGDLFTSAASLTRDENLQHYVIDQSVESYKAAVERDSSTANRIKLAQAYMMQRTSPMSGVSILLDIVNKDPNNIEAQLLLGNFGIMSGQFDKAIGRLEKVVSLQPQNDKAIYLLAIAYGSKGDKQKALELLDRCAKLDAGKPELLRNIEETRKGLLKGQ